MENNCYMTLMTELKFLPCIKRCSQAMNFFNSKYPYIVLIPEDKEYFKDEVIKYDIQYKTIKIDKFQNDNSYYDDTLNKFQIFNFLEYDKICFLDGDILIDKNIDNIFDTLSENYNIVKYIGDNNNNKNNKNFATGQIFIVRPHSDLYDIIKTFSFLYHNDEEILNFHDDINSSDTSIEKQSKVLKEYLNNSIIINSIPHGIVHLGGRIKAWEKNIEGFTNIKYFFTDMSDEEYYKVLLNGGFYHQYRSDYCLWTFYNSIFLKAYLIFINDTDELQKGIEIKKQLQENSCLFPIIFILNKNMDINKHNLNLLNIPYYIEDKDFNNINFIEKMKIIDKYTKENCMAICYIYNLDFKIEENIDYIFKKGIPEKYQNDILYLQYRSYDYI